MSYRVGFDVGGTFTDFVLQGPSGELTTAKRLAGHLTFFAFPLAARRGHDAAAFLREAGRPDAAGLLERKARCFGDAQYAAVQERWEETADLMERVADLEEALIHALTPVESAP